MTIRAKTALGLAALALASPAGAQDHSFKLHHFLSAESPAHREMLLPWAGAVEDKCDGRVDIEIFPAMTLGGRPPELIQQVRDGVVDLVWTVNGYTPGLFPRTEVMELPNVYAGDPAAANRVLYEMYHDGDIADDFRGVEVMFLHVHRGNAIQMADAPVRTPADLDGMDMRIPTRTGAWVIEALGANPKAMPVPDLPQALASGVVDGAFIPFEIIPALRLQEQTDYQIEGAGGYRFGNITFQLSMNADRWQALPADVRACFRDASGPEWWARVGRIWSRTDATGLGAATAAGNTHIVLTDAETRAFRAALEPVVARWIEDVSAGGIDGAALVGRARGLIAEYGAE